jgi:hypothetical protein
MGHLLSTRPLEAAHFISSSSRATKTQWSTGKLHISAIFSQISAFMIFNIFSHISATKNYFFPYLRVIFPDLRTDILTFSHISALFSHISAFLKFYIFSHISAFFRIFPISPRFFPISPRAFMGHLLSTRPLEAAHFISSSSRATKTQWSTPQAAKFKNFQHFGKNVLLSLWDFEKLKILHVLYPSIIYVAIRMSFVICM